ncbi:MAG: glycosyltransferase family 4 protein [Synechococcales cyanobacterium RU_4_20]|nr:glycosyltransferase family 4 protein [Synechococcales cyanobacterium RU_4_20]NJR69422.1 glycosyltransferase family 4 protein [Synechococcales cyanobacterium CRU_2_2]
MALNLLFVSTPVGPLGSGMGGGVELTLVNLAKALQQRGHRVRAIAPQAPETAFSELALPAPPPNLGLGFDLIQVPGQLQTSTQTQGRDALITLGANSALANMWAVAREIQTDFDILVNFAYDWLPLYLTPFFSIPVAHLISMGSLTDVMDAIIGETLERFPGCIGVHSRAQANTFAFGERCCILYNGFDLSQYQFRAQIPQPAPLGWVGRIAPEKGLEDAVSAAQQLQRSLKVWGAMQDEAYWRSIQTQYPNAALEYCGFLSTDQLQQQLGLCQGLIMTPKWVEAFGNVAIEALACGVPVVTYARGGPREIIVDGSTGWWVEPDSVSGLIEAIAKLDQLDRGVCRQAAEARYSLAAMGERVEDWLRSLLES